MLKAALAGAFAFATIGSLSISSGRIELSQIKAQEVVAETTGSVNAGPTVTEAKIARLRRALRLTAAQEVHWQPVESTLRKIAQASKREGSVGLVQRVKAKVSGYAHQASAYQQVASAAGPLIASLDEKQKQDGMRIIREFGFSGQ
jgi:hypothetical protein